MATQKTTFVVDADIRTAARGLDELAAKEEKVQRGFKAIGDAAQNMEIKVAAANRKVAEAVQGPRVTGGGGYVAAPSRAMGAYGIAPAVLPAAAKITGGYGGPGGHVIATPAGGGYGYGVSGEDPLAFGAAAIERMRQIQAIKPTAENDPHAARLRAAEIAAKVAAESRASMAKRHSASAQLEVQLWEANYAREQREAAERMAVSQNAHSIAQQVARESRASMAARAAAKEDDANRWEVAKFEHQYERNQRLKNFRQQRNRADLRAAGAGAVAAAGYAAYEMEQSREEARDRNVQFANDFRKIASLGDNSDIMGQKRDQILRLSAAFGVPTDQVISGMYDVESAASSLTPNEQRDLMTAGLQFNRLQGTDVGIGAKAVLKYKEIFGGKNGVQSINQAKSRLYKTADLGDLEIESFASLAPDLLARGKAMNVSDTNVLASTITATQKLGRTEKTLTSLGDFYMKAPDAAKKLGVELKGTLDDLDKLARFKPDELQNAFGTEVGIARVLIDARGEIRKLNDELKKIGPEADTVGEKLKAILKNPSIRFAEQQAADKQLIANQPLTKDYAEAWSQFDRDMNSREIAYRDVLGPAWSALAKPMTWLDTALNSVTPDSWRDGKGNDFMRARGEVIRRRAMGAERHDAVFAPPRTETDFFAHLSGRLNSAADNVATATRGALVHNAHVE